MIYNTFYSVGKNTKSKVTKSTKPQVKKKKKLKKRGKKNNKRTKNIKSSNNKKQSGNLTVKKVVKKSNKGLTNSNNIENSKKKSLIALKNKKKKTPKGNPNKSSGGSNWKKHVAIGGGTLTLVGFGAAAALKNKEQENEQKDEVTNISQKEKISSKEEKKNLSETEEKKIKFSNKNMSQAKSVNLHNSKGIKKNKITFNAEENKIIVDGAAKSEGDSVRPKMNQSCYNLSNFSCPSERYIDENDHTEYQDNQGEISVSEQIYDKNKNIDVSQKVNGENNHFPLINPSNKKNNDTFNSEMLDNLRFSNKRPFLKQSTIAEKEKGITNKNDIMKSDTKKLDLSNSSIINLDKTQVYENNLQSNKLINSNQQTRHKKTEKHHHKESSFFGADTLLDNLCATNIFEKNKKKPKYQNLNHHQQIIPKNQVDYLNNSILEQNSSVYISDVSESLGQSIYNEANINSSLKESKKNIQKPKMYSQIPKEQNNLDNLIKSEPVIINSSNLKKKTKYKSTLSFDSQGNSKDSSSFERISSDKNKKSFKNISSKSSISQENSSREIYSSLSNSAYENNKENPTQAINPSEKQINDVKKREIFQTNEITPEDFQRAQKKEIKKSCEVFSSNYSLNKSNQEIILNKEAESLITSRDLLLIQDAKNNLKDREKNQNSIETKGKEIKNDSLLNKSKIVKEEYNENKIGNTSIDNLTSISTENKKYIYNNKNLSNSILNKFQKKQNLSVISHKQPQEIQSNKKNEIFSQVQFNTKKNEEKIKKLEHMITNKEKTEKNQLDVDQIKKMISNELKNRQLVATTKVKKTDPQEEKNQLMMQGAEVKYTPLKPCGNPYITPEIDKIKQTKFFISFGAPGGGKSYLVDILLQNFNGIGIFIKSKFFAPWLGDFYVYEEGEKSEKSYKNTMEIHLKNTLEKLLKSANQKKLEKAQNIFIILDEFTEPFFKLKDGSWKMFCKFLLEFKANFKINGKIAHFCFIGNFLDTKNQNYNEQLKELDYANEMKITGLNQIGGYKKHQDKGTGVHRRCIVASSAKYSDEYIFTRLANLIILKTNETLLNNIQKIKNNIEIPEYKNLLFYIHNAIYDKISKKDTKVNGISMANKIQKIYPNITKLNLEYLNVPITNYTDYQKHFLNPVIEAILQKYDTTFSNELNQLIKIAHKSSADNFEQLFNLIDASQNNPARKKQMSGIQADPLMLLFNYNLHFRLVKNSKKIIINNIAKKEYKTDWFIKDFTNYLKYINFHYNTKDPLKLKNQLKNFKKNNRRPSTISYRSNRSKVLSKKSTTSNNKNKKRTYIQPTYEVKKK